MVSPGDAELVARPSNLSWVRLHRIMCISLSYLANFGPSRTLTLFLQDGVDCRFLRQNRVIALDLLRSLSEKSGLALQETCILTWGQIASYV